MKANIETVKNHLLNNEEIITSINCTINLGYIERPGILVATKTRILFCADHLIGKGFSWEFEYDKITNLKESNGFVQGTLPFIKKITMYHEQDFVVFTNFNDINLVQGFLEVVKVNCN
jgi:hypothetical protein